MCVKLGICTFNITLAPHVVNAKSGVREYLAFVIRVVYIHVVLRIVGGSGSSFRFLCSETFAH